MKEVWLIGSGPSAQGITPPPEVETACVNASLSLLSHRPTYYLVGERPAAIEYADEIISCIECGTKVLMRPHAYVQLLKTRGYELTLPPWTVTLIHRDFGPDALRSLHNDHGTAPKTSKAMRPRNNWLSSGVLMMWWLAHEIKPEKIRVFGLDGYPSQVPENPKFMQVQGWTHGEQQIPGEYADGIKALPTRPARLPEWADAQNGRMAEAIGMITRHYTDTEFEWRRKPLHWTPEWRVSFTETANGA